MNAYLIVKTLHILSATLMVGTGFGTAFYLFWANRCRACGCCIKWACRCRGAELGCG